eukprot:COSAG06_NODE_45453_length_354_cov_2.227451_1_plen_54_part_10
MWACTQDKSVQLKQTDKASARSVPGHAMTGRAGVRSGEGTAHDRQRVDHSLGRG